MRTTLTIDDDVAAFLREQARRLDLPFARVVNDTLRRAMPPADGGDAPAGETPRRPFRVRPNHGGLGPEIDPADPKTFKKLLDRLDMEHFLDVQRGDRSGDP